MAEKHWIRTCQECGYEQETKPTPEYKSEAWRTLKCKKCKSEGLDYGKWVEDEVEGEK